MVEVPAFIFWTYINYYIVWEGKAILEWITKFSDKELQAPFTVKTDFAYYDDLRKRYTHFVNRLKNASADIESQRIVKRYSDKVCEALRDYYKGSITSCHQKIENLVKGCAGHILALADLSESRAFPGVYGSEIQFFRARVSSEARQFTSKDMLHVPFDKRGKSGNYRFSIPGVISLYLANSSYGCWIEMGKPSEHDFYVAPAILDGNQKVFNLAVLTRDLSKTNDADANYIHCWLKLLVLMIATSYNVEEKGRIFQSEYIISQSIMLACKKLGFDGVAYFSKRLEGEWFFPVSINLALFANYKKYKKYGPICEHMKVDEPMNYQLFRQLRQDATYQKYSLRVDSTIYTTNIGNYRRQYKYQETDFHRFDEHLFGSWTDKDSLDWGNALQ